MFKDDYRAAFEKIAPSDAWKRETLAKMRALEAEQECMAAVREPESAPVKKGIPFAAKLRRAALPVAAALAIAVIPMTTLRGCGSAAPMATQEGAEMDAAPYEASGRASEERQKELIGEVGAAPAPAAGNDGEAPTEGKTDSASGLTYGSVLPRQAERARPVTSANLEVTLTPEDAVFAYMQENSGMGMGGMLVKTEDASELAGDNPTLDLPSDQMPAALPVYRAALDSGEMYDTLAGAAALLGDTVVEEKEGFSAEIVPQEAVDAGARWRRPSAFVTTENKLSMNYEAYTVHFYSHNHDDDALMKAPAGETDLQHYYYENYGQKLQPLESPTLEVTGDYGFSGDFLDNQGIYEAGSADDPIETQLYNYTFKRIELAAKEDTGDLFVVNYTLPPEEIGVCALRTLDEARDVLRSGNAWVVGQIGGYDPDELHVLHWEIAYGTSPLMDTIQPVYRFLIDDTRGDGPAESGSENLRSVVYATVPALRPEYLTETTYEQTFN